MADPGAHMPVQDESPIKYRPTTLQSQVVIHAHPQ